MRRARRWAAVLAATLAVVSLPWLMGRIPAGHSAVTARSLLYRIQGSGRVAYSGDAQATGSLAVPDLAPLGQVSDLFGGTTTLRIWWRDDTAFRVDTVQQTGEQDVYEDRTGTWTWNYESNTAVRSSHGPQPLVVRLPTASDLAPPSLARRLLSEAHVAEVSRLPEQRVAGRDVAGLRLRPADPASTVDHVDVWALPNTGLALRVQVYGKGIGRAVLSSSLLDVHLARPSTSLITFRPPPDARTAIDDFPDEVSTIDRRSFVRPPPVLAGQIRRYRGAEMGGGAVGVYGRGVTRFVAIPLRPNQARALGLRLAGTVGSAGEQNAMALTIGPVNLLLTAADPVGGRWLLAGTVTAATLARAAASGALPPVVGRFR